MSAQEFRRRSVVPHDHDNDYEMKAPAEYSKSAEPESGASEYDIQTGQHGELKRSLKSRHMQFIAIGGAIGAGLFVSLGNT